MSSVVVTGTGLLTAAGLGHAALWQALRSGKSFVQLESDGLRGSLVAASDLFWPDLPEWQAAREYAGHASQLAVTACQQALTAGAAPLQPERGATIAVNADDWTEQRAFDRALGTAASARGEARALFGELDDQFLLRTFRWGVGFAIGALTGFQGPAVGIDAPCFGGLSGLRHAMDLIESGEADAVMLVGVDTVPRLDVAASLERLARERAMPALCFGQGAVAVLLERSSTALSRGVRPLARVVECELNPRAESSTAAASDFGGESRAASEQVLGSLLNTGALVDVCLATQWLAEERAAGRTESARVARAEAFWGSGVAQLRLETWNEGSSES